MPDKDTVLLTGASGFIAKHIALDLVRRGYRVRGTVRSPEKADEVRAILRREGADADAFSAVRADLDRDEGWDDAAAGCRFVLHTASPFPVSQPRDKFALVPQARGGTVRVVEAAKRSGAERVVVTSSVASIGYGHGGKGTRRFGAETFSNVESDDISPYAVSKTEAEKAAWATVAGGAPSLATINPALVFGPLLDASLGTSAKLMSMMMAGRLPVLPDLGFGIVDVRDVAHAHVEAMERPEAAGRRFVLSAGNLKLMDVATILREAHPDRARRLPRFRIPTALIRAAALVSGQARMLASEVGSEKVYDSEPARRVLGLDLRSPREAALALAESLVRFDRA